MASFLAISTLMPGLFHFNHMMQNYSLVGADTGCFQRFRAQLLIFVGDKVDAEREFVNVRALL